MGVMSQFTLDGKTALVTGGAQGLGKAMAEALAEAGASIIIMVDQNIELADTVAAEIQEKFSRETMSFKGDVRSPSDVEAVVSQVVERFGKLDIMVNNAGIVRFGKAEEMSLNDWSDVMDVNLTGVFICSQIAGRQMIKQGGGVIINIASMSGLIVNYPQTISVYNTSKAGVIHLTKCLAAEWAPHNIRVNAICPGYMKTEMVAELLDQEMAKTHWIGRTPMNRAGIPDELGGLVVYLASDASSFMTGSEVVIDGGYTVW